MKKTVLLKDNSYDIQIENSFEALSLPHQNILIISDSNVAPLYANELKQQLEKKKAKVSISVFPAGESHKNLKTIEQLYQDCCNAKLDRKSCIVALGGGVTGDMAGFAAATFLRGIDYIQVPTSLLAQADSSVGGKTGVDFSGGKNLIGAFWQPKLVYMNLATLHSLPEKEFHAGMAEIIKHGLIRNKGLYQFLSEQKDGIKARDYLTVSKMMAENCMVKAEVVTIDEKEAGMRAILNFGHTIGHAVESAMNFQLLHGECVAIGMAASMEISCLRGMLTPQQRNEAMGLLEYFSLPTTCHCGKDAILEEMKKDKKRENGIQKFILLDGIGSCKIVTDITQTELNQALEYIQ